MLPALCNPLGTSALHAGLHALHQSRLTLLLQAQDMTLISARVLLPWCSTAASRLQSRQCFTAEGWLTLSQHHLRLPLDIGQGAAHHQPVQKNTRGRRLPAKATPNSQTPNPSIPKTHHRGQHRHSMVSTPLEQTWCVVRYRAPGLF